MRHVFVETNWVVECAAPAHHKTPAALELLKRAASGELKLYLPVICGFMQKWGQTGRS